MPELRWLFDMSRDDCSHFKSLKSIVRHCQVRTSAGSGVIPS